MAFVFQAEKKSIIESQTKLKNSPGPGSYNLLYEDVNTSINKKQKIPYIIPFGSESLRNQIPKAKKIELENSPGPGSYYVDYSSNKLKKISEQKRENVNLPLYKLVENNEEFNKKDYIPMGFNTSEKRFSSDLKSYNKTPGPGTYGSIDYKFSSFHNNGRNTLNTLTGTSSIQSSLVPEYRINSSPAKNKGSHRNLNRSVNKSLKFDENENDGNNKVASIPSKLYCYGYEVNKKGYIIPSNDPLKNRKHLGERKDSVGPCDYNIDVSKQWLNKGTSWSKSKCIKNPGPKQSDNDNSILSNSVSTQSQSIELNNTSKPIRMLNKVEKEILIKNFKQRKIMSKESQESIRSAMGDTKYSKIDEIINLADTPGPGYYYNPEKFSAFNKRPIPEEFQSFGSSCARFSNQNQKSLSSNISNDYLGPGAYFRDDSLIENKKLKEIISKQRLKPVSTSLTKTLIGSVDEVKTTKTNKYGNLFNIKDTSPGPGKYNLPASIKYKVNPNNRGIFGSTEKKLMMKEKEETVGENVGPGSYNYKDDWVKLNKDTIHQIMNSPNKKYGRPKPIDKGLIPREKEEEDVGVPAVGSYDLDKIYSMEYRVAKNASKLSLVNAPFNSLGKRFTDDIIKKQEGEDLGPGYYYKNIKFSPKPNMFGFNSSDKRVINRTLEEGVDVGPGQYNKNSYFDWNKKSFNIQFL